MLKSGKTDLLLSCKRNQTGLMPYFGEYQCKIDPKGRIKIPSQLLRQLQVGAVQELVVHRGFEKCLVLYERSVWDRVVEEVRQLSIYDKQEREFLRYFFRGATSVMIDNADRFIVSKRLKEHAGIGKEVVLSTLYDRIEIWDPQIYEEMVAKEPDDLSLLAQNIFGRLRGESKSDV